MDEYRHTKGYWNKKGTKGAKYKKKNDDNVQKGGTREIVRVREGERE